MRVIAGRLRHRKLVYPENNKDIRPTKDRIREAHFSSLGDISNKTFLDLYAGCGSMGIEAISRGARKAYFVDISSESLRFVKENVKSLDIFNEVEIIKSSDLDALKEFKEKGLKFDIIYLDPPYEKGQYEEVLNYIYINDLINENGVVSFEANRIVSINPLWNITSKEYHYGEITVTTLRKK